MAFCLVGVDLYLKETISNFVNKEMQEERN